MKLKTLSYFLGLFVLLLSSCQDKNLEGLYEEEGKEYNTLLVFKTDKGYDCVKGRKGSRFIRYTKKGSGEYTFKNRKLVDVGNEKIRLHSSANKVDGTYVRKEVDRVPLKSWGVYKGMTTEMVASMYEEPDTIVMTESGSEKWFYPNDIAVVFWNEKLIRIRENYKLHRDFSSISSGMQKQAVLKLIGNPDRETKKDNNNTLFYGLKTRIVFENDLVTEVLLDKKVEGVNLVMDFEEEGTTTSPKVKQPELVDEIHALIGATKWHKQNKEEVVDFMKKLSREKKGALEAWEVVGVFGLEKEAILSVPYLMIIDKKMERKVPSLIMLEHEFNAITMSVKDLNINGDISALVNDLDFKKAVLVKEKNLILLETKAEMRSNSERIVRQAIYHEDYRVKIIQFAYVKGKHEKHLSEFNKVVSLMENK